MSQQLELFGPIVGIARDLEESHQVLRDYAEKVNISRVELDDLSKLPDGYSAKLLSDPPRKQFGMTSFWSIVDALGLAVAFVKDKRRAARLAKAPQRRIVPNNAKHWRNAKALSMAAQIVKKSAIVWGKQSSTKRMETTTKEQRSQHARMMANARWRAHRRRLKEVRAMLDRA